ncbi:DNA polymerase III subunit chi [Sphingomonas sp. RS6]
MQVDFYHLTRAPLDRVLPQLAEKVLGNGGRLLVVAADPVLRARIDQLLWTYAPGSFLPHAEAGGEHDSDQPVLIADAATPVNSAGTIAIVDGTWRDEALAFGRALHLFDDSAIDAARAAWRGLGAQEGIERRFWKQDEDGRWVKIT